MLRHTVMLKLKDDAAADRRDEIVDGLRALAAQIPQVRTLQAHADAGLQRGNHDVVLVADFADDQALKTYLRHPAHRRLLDELIVPALAGMAVVQHRV